MFGFSFKNKEVNMFIPKLSKTVDLINKVTNLLADVIDKSIDKAYLEVSEFSEETILLKEKMHEIISQFETKINSLEEKTRFVLTSIPKAKLFSQKLRDLLKDEESGNQ